MSTTIISTTTKKYQDIVVGASSMAENAPNTIANTFVPSASINAKRKASTEISDVATKNNIPKLPKNKKTNTYVHVARVVRNTTMMKIFVQTAVVVPVVVMISNQAVHCQVVEKVPSSP